MTPAMPTGGPQPVWVPSQWLPPQTTAPLGRRWLVLLVSGGTAFLVGLILAFVAVSGTLSEPVLAGPGTVSEHVHQGTYLLFAQTGTSSGFGGVTVFSSHPPAQLSADATHLSLDTQPLTITGYQHSYSSTLQLGNRTFEAVAEVRVPHDGTLSLTADRDEGALVVAPTIGETAEKLIAPTSLAIVGLIAAIAAVIWRIRAGKRRQPRWAQGHWSRPVSG